MDRRTLMQQIAGAAGAALWTGDTLAVEMSKAAATRPTDGVASRPFPKALKATLEAVCDVIIPATDSPGAVASKVPTFVASMFEHWMNAVERDSFESGLRELDAVARAQFRKPFATLKPSERGALFGGLRAGIKDYRPAGGFGLAARIADPAAPFFYKARDLVTVGYFTSQVGINAELAYIAVPGRFDGDVDVKTWNRQMQL